MSKRTNDTIVRVVHNAVSQGEMTWKDAKALAWKYAGKLTFVETRKGLETWQITSDKKQSRG